MFWRCAARASHPPTLNPALPGKSVCSVTDKCIIDRLMACAWPVSRSVCHAERCRVCAGWLCCRQQSTFLSSNTSSPVSFNGTVSLLHQLQCRCMNELSRAIAVLIGATQADVDDVASALTSSSVRLVSSDAKCAMFGTAYAAHILTNKHACARQKRAC